ncbi:MAG: response regulator [Gemmatimonadaceae bacterium]
MTESESRTLRILLVEDSPTDALLTQEAFADSPYDSVIYRVENGVEALAFLRREGRYADAPRPDLVLLDWNLPRKHGREVLREAKVDEALRSIPVVVLSTSHADSDIRTSYDLHANCYISKPVGFDEFNDVVQSVRDFWFRTACLPDSGDA